jgi:hypothetical protein
MATFNFSFMMVFGFVASFLYARQQDGKLPKRLKMQLAAALFTWLLINLYFLWPSLPKLVGQQ